MFVYPIFKLVSNTTIITFKSIINSNNSYSASQTGTLDISDKETLDKIKDFVSKGKPFYVKWKTEIGNRVVGYFLGSFNEHLFSFGFATSRGMSVLNITYGTRAYTSAYVK